MTAAAVTVTKTLRSSKLVVVIVVGSTASLNVAVTVVAVVTLVALSVGDTDVTVGGVTSAATVVKDQTRSAARALPTRSFTPVEPPLTRAVKVAELGSAAV